MEYFSEVMVHANLLLGKPWLVRIDSDKSIPYLMKFHHNEQDMSCCLIITDTRTLWAEVLTSKQLRRRWIDVNHPNEASSSPETDDKWLRDVLTALSQLHSLGGIMDTSFEAAESRFSDFAFVLDGPVKFRWETFLVGPRISAEVLSAHLILPLISVTHLAFSSADPVSELSEGDLEKTTDKTARTAKRTGADTHIKHAMSKPRVATTLARINAVFHSTSDIPAIFSDTDRPDIAPPPLPAPPALQRINAPSKAYRSPSPMAVEEPPTARSPSPPAVEHPQIPESGHRSSPKAAEESATESEDDLPAVPGPSKPISSVLSSTDKSGTHSPKADGSAPPQHQPASASDSDSDPPPPPRKRTKPVRGSSSDADSDTERRSKPVSTSGRGGAPAKRGARQPLKRGVKRF